MNESLGLSEKATNLKRLTYLGGVMERNNPTGSKVGFYDVRPNP
jgi:hypothetical protein